MRAALVSLLLAGTALAVLPDAAPNRPVQDLREGYVTSSACRSCHPGEYATWYASYHRTMTQVATPETALGDFDDARFAIHGEHFRLYRADDELRVEIGSELFGQSSLVDRRVVMSTGSHHFQAYWVETGERRKIDLLPMAWHIVERRWVAYDSLLMSPPDPRYRQAGGGHAGGQWNTRCVRCHSTGFRPRALEPEGMDTRVSEFGIACEACHGPGAEHVSRNRDPRRRYALRLTGERDPTIVHPGRIDHRRSSEICGQCHGSRAPYEGQDKLDFYNEGSRYLPGDVLARTHTMRAGDGPQRLDREIQTQFWPDGRVRVIGREHNGMLRTACYTRGEMSCVSCHTLHPAADARIDLRTWANDQLAPGMDGSRACVQCHPSFESGALVRAHTHHLEGSSGSDCLNCHMPYTAWGLQKATRSHELSNPDVAESLELGRPNACNQCHLDRTLQWAADQLAQWYGIAAPEGLEDDGIAAGVRWAVAGDAAQRGLAGWSMGWAPAQQASGTRWLAPYLAFQLADAYPVNRYVALRSLRTLPGFTDFDYDYTGSDEHLDEAIERAIERFVRQGRAGRPRNAEAVLIGPAGGVDQARYLALAAERNDRAVYLLE